MSNIRRTISISMDLDLATALHQYAIAQECASIQEAARQAIRMGLASTPEDGALLAAKISAFNETRNWALDQLKRALYDMAKLLETSTGAKIYR